LILIRFFGASKRWLSTLSFRVVRRLVEFFGFSRKLVLLRKVLTDQAGNDLLRESIRKGSPILISRFGTTEMEFCLDSYIPKVEYPGVSEKTMNLWRLSGVFPLNGEQLSKFFDVYTSSARSIDICGLRIKPTEYSYWNLETRMLREFQLSAAYIDIDLLFPISVKDPWTNSLEGKKILVIHPFKDSIEKQLLLRDSLFKDADWLPKADYTVLKAPQTLSATSANETWADNLQETMDRISKVDFDIALIGCGAYGLPLGAKIKEGGKIAIHVGGALQLFFGILGLRWESELEKIIPETNLKNWCWPDATETPLEAKVVEGGAYWGRPSNDSG